MVHELKLNNNLTRILMRTESNFQVNYGSSVSLKVWHERLGHVNRTSIENMMKNNVVSGFSVQNKNGYFCEGCLLAKQFKSVLRKTRKFSVKFLVKLFTQIYAVSFFLLFLLLRPSVARDSIYSSKMK